MTESSPNHPDRAGRSRTAPAQAARRDERCQQRIRWSAGRLHTRRPPPCTLLNAAGVECDHFNLDGERANLDQHGPLEELLVQFFRQFV